MKRILSKVVYLLTTMSALGGAECQLDPLSVAVTNGMGEQMLSALRISNSGDAPLTLHFRSVCGARLTPEESDSVVHEVSLLAEAPDGVKEQDLVYEFDSPEIHKEGAFDSILLRGCERWVIPDSPVLPVHRVLLAVPPGMAVEKISAVAEEEYDLGGAFIIEPGAPQVPLNRPSEIRVGVMNPDVYQRDADWPGYILKALGQDRKSGYDLYRVNLFPVQYNPVRMQVRYIKRIRLKVTYSPSDSSYTRIADADLKKDLAKRVDNPNNLNLYDAAVLPKNLITSQLHLQSLSEEGPYDYLVITSPMLAAEEGEYTFQNLVRLKNQTGTRARIVTTDWIYANYPGERPDGTLDNQTRIRNFLQDAYSGWGVKYVLLGGDCSIVPVRCFSLDYSDGMEDIPSDLYYACLDPVSCSFDENANGVYGEDCDGPDGADVDLAAELYVGRAPVETVEEMERFVRKTIAYETGISCVQESVSMVGERLGFGGESEYACQALEQIRLGGNYDDYETRGFANHGQPDYVSFDLTRNLYEQERNWSFDDLALLMRGGTHIINHFGHANYDSVMKITRSNVGDLNNGQPLFVYSQGCLAGAFDEEDAIAECLVLDEDGAFAVIMNSRYGWGAYHSTDGASHRYARQFWDAVLDERLWQLGQANQDSKEDNLWDISDSVVRWCYYELNLLGDPQLSLRVRKEHAWLMLDQEELTVPSGGEGGPYSHPEC